MKHAVTLFLLSTVLLVSCSKRERSDAEEAEWAEIEALAADAAEVPASGNKMPNAEPTIGTVADSEFEPYLKRLAEMKTIQRAAGETLLTSERLVLDDEKRFVQMEENVVVVDDQGTLMTDRLVGRFSVSNEVEFIEAHGNVGLVSSNRSASAEHAIYNYRSGYVQMEGKASASDGSNRLSGERIKLWIRGNRKMICEPNVLLEISPDSGVKIEGMSGQTNALTEVRADLAEYNEEEGWAELVGRVRIRDSRAAMNCEKIRIYLKEDNEIDWIEAVGEVIIQSDDRKALADRATYHADEGKFVLEGDPKVKQGLNVMTGDRIVFWHENRRMVCEPNARVLLYLDEETKAKFLKDIDD
ncbi:LptA/OstA family protein [Pontiellaceae bacterium B12219]|nr:LptA/OstA family protein [Pontiellaceae bacterium B12219]